jgi:hypothetical protein
LASLDELADVKVTYSSQSSLNTPKRLPVKDGGVRTFIDNGVETTAIVDPKYADALAVGDRDDVTMTGKHAVATLAFRASV